MSSTLRSGATLLCVFGSACADGPSERFAAEAAPVLEARCAMAACHGAYEGEELPQAGLFFRIDAAGRLADLEGARAAAETRISVRAPRASTLLRIPLPGWAGGGPHAGGASFQAPDDEALEAMLRWIEVEESGGEDLDLSPLEQRYAAEVVPVLIERCAREGCHGSRDVAFASFALHPVGAQVTDADVRASRRAVRKHLDLWGSDPARSRLVRKALGADAGGLVHRGGASTLFPEAPDGDPLDAPGLSAILRWARAERDALGVVEGHEPAGVLFVEGPAAPRAPYRIEPGRTGSDLFLAGWPRPGTPENLSAHLHPEGPVELRDPALSHDAAHVAFAMRRGDEDRFAIYTLTLATRELRRITRAEDPGSFVQPVYGPDGRIVAVWDGHGELAADGDGVAPELVAIGGDGSLERLTFTPAPEVAPAILAAGKTRGELVFGTRREGARGPEGVLFRFPLCHDPSLHGEPEYHVQLGATLAPDAPLLARDLPDGRQIMIVLESSAAADDRGMLAIADRSLGPHLGESIEDASVGGYRPPIAWLDRSARFRDPAALPDGRLLFVDGGAIVIARVDDGPGGASLGPLEPYLTSPRELRSPVVVMARPLEDDEHAPTTDSSRPDGILALRDLAVLESLYERAEPRGARPLRDDVASLRLLASQSAQARHVRRYADGGTTVGLSRRIPARVLAEIDLPADRSAFLRVPARLPIRLALLDARGMEVGHTLDRWYYAEGGETVPGGTNPRNYAHACAACHGAASGDPSDAAASPPDAISSASITLSTHQDRDPRRPLPPLDAIGEGAQVDFVTTLAARLATGCASAACHGGDSPAAELPLDDRSGGGRFPPAYEALVRFVDLEGLRARRSTVIERLLGRELDAPSEVRGACPADEALVRDTSRWIEAGAFYDLSLREAP